MNGQWLGVSGQETGVKPSMPDDRTNADARRRWHGAAAGPGVTNRRHAGARKGRRIFLLLAGMLALGGAIIAVAWLLPHPPNPAYVHTIPVSEYQDARWPVNPLVVQDSDTLWGHF